VVEWIVWANDLPADYRFLLIPFALVPMTHAILLGRGPGTFSAIYVSLLGCLVVQPESVMSYLVVSLVAGLTAVQVVHNARQRGRLMRAGFYVGGVVLLLCWILGHIEIEAMGGVPVLVDIQRFGLASLAAFVTGVITAMVVSGVLPVLESIFQITTEISWLELSDLNHRLLRRMQLEAPGTFHHSLVVAALAESAAESIGASAATARVCSYFHDIGKLVKPLYFIENQGDLEENPHDSLTPTMSALIIIAHVKDGVDLALKHKLNPRIIDVIREHHGDSLVYFFYRKAQEQRKADLEKVSKGLEDPDDLPKIDEKSFRYPGPRPRTRESGIVSLADAVESASRSLQKPTPAKIKALIDEIVQTRIAEGQLDQCQLTLAELAVVKECFGKTLRSMVHSRIDYPKDEERTTGGRKSDAGRDATTMGGRKSDTDRETKGNGGRRPVTEKPAPAGQGRNPTQRPQPAESKPAAPRQDS
jgi:putative nucleotidyltransferase with HDIG domain